MPSVIVIGAGLAGLTAARHLHRANWQVTLLEARDRIGGRIQTDEVDGFLLDHGFQVYLTGYELAGRELDLAQLRLGTFPAGAFVQLRGRRYRVCDPLRSAWYNIPKHTMQTLFAPVGSMADKLRIASFRRRVCRSTPEQLLVSRDETARERLEQMGFSQTIIERFFRPFFGGIFLDDSLGVAAGRMEFVFRTFSRGLAALPAEGMQAIPKQLASWLPSDVIHLNTTVARVGDGQVELSDGRVLEANHVILATEEAVAEQLVGAGQLRATVTSRIAAGPSTSCVYFEVTVPPMQEATLVLNGDRIGPINNLCFPSFAQPSYAPPGKTLLSVSTLGNIESTGEALLDGVRAQLIDWFGTPAQHWRHLRSYRIPYALPDQTPRALAGRVASIRMDEKVWRCGDYCETGSIEGAIRSGITTAQLLLRL